MKVLDSTPRYLRSFVILWKLVGITDRQARHQNHNLVWEVNARPHTPEYSTVLVLYIEINSVPNM